MGDFTLATPVTRSSETKYTVDRLDIRRSGQAFVEVVAQDSGGLEDIRRFAFTVPDTAHPSATLANFIGALLNARSGETGTNARRANFRVLGYLVDQSYLPAGTLNP